MAEKQLIMVLGMGRSGTSAIAKVLALCGGRLPALLMPPNFANPSGYWEPEVAVAINDAFLLRQGSSWYDPTLRLQSRDRNVEVDVQNAFVVEIAAFLRASSGPESLVVKEPRITGLLPYWLEAAKRERYSVAFVIALRDPGEVAQSLLARDGISGDFSDVLWLKYTLLAERGSRLGPRVVVSFSALVAAWEAQVERIGSTLGIDLMPLAGRDDVDSFLKVDLYHHRRGDEGSGRATLPLTERIFAQMRSAAADGSLDASALDGAFDEYLACDRRVRREESASVPPSLVVPSVSTDGAQLTEAEIDRRTIPAWDAVGVRLAKELRTTLRR